MAFAQTREVYSNVYIAFSLLYIPISFFFQKFFFFMEGLGFLNIGFWNNHIHLNIIGNFNSLYLFKNYL